MDRAFLYEMFEWCTAMIAGICVTIAFWFYTIDRLYETADYRKKRRALRREYRNLKREIRREHAVRKSLQRRLRRYDRYQQISTGDL